MRFGLAQMDIVWEDKEANKEKCLGFIERAQKEKVQLLVFPEMTLTGFSMNIEDIAEHNKQTVKWFKEKARQFGMYIGFGYVEKVDYKAKNNFTIVSPNDEGVTYTKIHPFSYSDETKYFIAGTEIKKVLINSAIITPFICYDLRFPEIFQAASNEATVIIVAANWPEVRREHWITLLRARAIENQCFIIGINRVGIGNDIAYSGDSMIVDPLGNILTSNNGEEKLLSESIDINTVNDLRNGFALKKDRKEDLYVQLYLDKGEK